VVVLVADAVPTERMRFLPLAGSLLEGFGVGLVRTRKGE